jgi:hypothetical protein
VVLVVGGNVGDSHLPIGVLDDVVTMARGLEVEQMGGTPYNENAVTKASEEPTSRTKDGRHPRGQQ